MKKSTRNILLFIALFSIISATGGLITKLLFKADVPVTFIVGGLISGMALTYAVKSYDVDDDFMPKGKRLK